MGRIAGKKHDFTRGNVKNLGIPMNEKELARLDELRFNPKSKYYGLKPSDLIRFIMLKEYNNLVEGETTNIKFTIKEDF